MAVKYELERQDKLNQAVARAKQPIKRADAAEARADEAELQTASVMSVVAGDCSLPPCVCHPQEVADTVQQNIGEKGGATVFAMIMGATAASAMLPKLWKGTFPFAIYGSGAA